MDTATESEQLTVGQRVWIYDVNDRRKEGPWEGEVTKVGRKLVHIAWSLGYGGTDVFRIDEQRANDNYGHQWFRTDAQRVAHDRLDAAVRVLIDHRVFLNRGHGLTVEQVEALAAVFD